MECSSAICHNSRLWNGWVCLLLAAVLPAAAAELQPVPPPAAQTLSDVIDAALVSQWEQSGRGAVKGRIWSKGDGNLDVALSLVWDDDRVRYHYQKYEQDRIPPVAGQPKRQQNPLVSGSWSPQEHWQYDPSQNLAVQLTGRFHRDVNDGMDLRPRGTWLDKTDSNSPSHVERFRYMRPRSEVLKTETGNIVYRTDLGELEFAPDQDYRVVRHELTHPNNPRRYLYTLARDAHGVWYPREIHLTRFVKNSTTRIASERFIAIDEYTSQPTPEQLRFGVDTLGVAKGTRMTHSGDSRIRDWVYGVSKPTSGELQQLELDRLIDKARSTGLSAPSRE